MNDHQKSDLYQSLVDLCQQYGFTTESTYDHLHDAVESIREDAVESILEEG